MMASMADRLSGRAMVERTRESGVRSALNPQEMIALVGLALIGIALLFPPPNYATLLHDNTLWGVVALLLAAPQALGLALARMGYVEVPMAHRARMALLLASFAVALTTTYIFAEGGFIWLGAGFSLLTAISFASASRYVHLYNGRSRQTPRLDAEVNKALVRGGYASERLLRRLS